MLRRTSFDKVLRDKTFNIVKNPKYDGYQRDIASMVYKFSDKTSSGANTLGGAVTRANKSAIKSKIMPNQRPSNLATRQ